MSSPRLPSSGRSCVRGEGHADQFSEHAGKDVPTTCGHDDFCDDVLVRFLASFPGAPEGATEPAINCSLAAMIGGAVQPMLVPVGFKIKVFRWPQCEVAMKKLNAATAVTAAFAVLTIAAGLSAAELKILSAGAVQPGLNAAAKIFFDKTGDLVTIAYDPATILGKRVAGGEVADIIVSSPAVIAELIKTAKVLPGGQVPLGKVGVGVVVREGAPAPDISSMQALRKTLLEAEAVVYNTASSGAYVEDMLKKMGVFDTPRQTGASV